MGIPFACDSGKTWDEKGAKIVWVKSFGNGAYEKRQATLQLCIRAKGQQIPVAVIFRGTGKRVKVAEKAAYHPKVSLPSTSILLTNIR